MRKSGQAIGTELLIELSPTFLDAMLSELGMDDDMVEPMPCCGLPVKLGDTEFGVSRWCERGRCVQFECECGRVWATVQAMGCPCPKEES